MKKLSTLLLACLITSQTSFGQKSVDRFIDKYLKEDETIAMTFPGWLFGSTMKFAAMMDEDEELADYAKLASHVKNIRVFVAKENHNIPSGSVKSLITKMTKSEGYDEYIRIRSGESKVNLFAIEKNDTIKRLVFFIDDEDNFVLLRLKLDLPYSAFEELNYKIQKEIHP